MPTGKPSQYVISGQRCYRRVGRGEYVQLRTSRKSARPLLATQVMLEREPGIFCITHRCVFSTACEVCGAPAGKLCTGSQGERTSIHIDRAASYYAEQRIRADHQSRVASMRRKAARLKQELAYVEAQIDAMLKAS